MKSKKFVIALAMSVAAALTITNFSTAQAAVRPANKATVGDQCIRAGAKAVGRGVNGTDLTCTKVVGGSFDGTLRWWYPEAKPFDKLEWVSSSNIGGGYGTTAIAIADALKKEALLKDYTVTYRSNAALGMGYFSEQKGRKDLLAMTGFAMPGSFASLASKMQITDFKGVAAMMREAEAIVVPTNSKFKNINEAVAAIKASPSTVAIGGGNYGGVDHVTIATIMAAQGVAATSLNYIPYSGGASLVPDVISGRVAIGIAGTSEFASYVAAGKMRVLALSSAKPLSAIKGRTLIQQNINMTFGNWRGILAPADLPDSDLLNMAKIFDELHASPAWKETLAAKSWLDDYKSGSTFNTWLKTENKTIVDLLVAFKLVK